MTSEIPFLTDPRQAALRLEGVEYLSADLPGLSAPLELQVALPACYDGKKPQAYPLLLLANGASLFGSAVEMTRLMAQTKELRECIVVAFECRAGAEAEAEQACEGMAEVLQWCSARYRIDAARSALFGSGDAGACVLQAFLFRAINVPQAIVVRPEAGPALRMLGRPLSPSEPPKLQTRRLILLQQPGASNELMQSVDAFAGREPGLSVEAGESGAPAAWVVPDLINGLRALWSTSKRYGADIELLRHPWMRPVFRLLSLLRRAPAPPPVAAQGSNPHLLRSASMQRDFELFVSLPASYSPASRRSYPAVLVFDANIEYAIVAEAAAALARAGAIDEAIVIGIGTPRAEGAVEFAYRRFEEFSPPIEEYDYSDALGNIFRGLFAARGQDARDRLGLAPALYHSVCEEMLPQLLQHFPIDSGRLSIVGHSAGGTFACYALQQPQSPFRHYIAVSPGIGMSGFWLMRKLVQSGEFAAQAASVTLSIGAEEQANPFNQYAGIPQTGAYAEQLRVRGVPGVSYRCFDGETHSSTYPAAVLHGLLVSLRRGDGAAQAAA
jgi:predicted alpha/beta superfamily hydrolase